MAYDIPFGHPLAKKVFGAAVFAQMTKKPGWSKNLFGPAPKLTKATAKLRNQTPHEFPFIRITDLSKGGGDTVTVDLFNVLTGKPVVGDNKIQGKLMTLKSATTSIKINQLRAGVDTGGRMAQQRTIYDLRTLGRAGLEGYWARMRDQILTVHVAGARGSFVNEQWAIPLESDPDFNDIMVNPILPPTYDRHFFANTKTGITGLTTSDILTLEDIDRLRAMIDDFDFPMQPIMLPDDAAREEDPLYALFLTTRQWHILQTRTGEKAWRTFLQNARERGSKNPLFLGTPGLWNGILIKKMVWPIRFYPGDSVQVSDATNTVAGQTVPNFGAGSAAAAKAAGHAVDRAVLLGAQALAEVYGADKDTGGFMGWHEEETDHGNAFEASVRGMGGFSKLQFKNRAETLYDHGVLVIDSYAPDPKLIKV